MKEGVPTKTFDKAVKASSLVASGKSQGKRGRPKAATERQSDPRAAYLDERHRRRNADATKFAQSAEQEFLRHKNPAEVEGRFARIESAIIKNDDPLVPGFSMVAVQTAQRKKDGTINPTAPLQTLLQVRFHRLGDHIKGGLDTALIGALYHDLGTPKSRIKKVALAVGADRVALVVYTQPNGRGQSMLLPLADCPVR